MKFLHTADLHIGKKVNEFSMLEDQIHILGQILSIVDDFRPDGVLLAGDLYDKGIPTVEGVNVMDDFLTRLHEKHVDVFFISGNHDSPQRLSFGGRILKDSRIHVAAGFNGCLQRVECFDSYGKINVYLLPFVRPGMAARYDEGVTGYHDAVASVIRRSEVDAGARNVLLAHQFVTDGERQPEQCESELISVGGLDNVDVSVFAPFDYVALGHLHRPQHIGRESVRYAGSPLKYSFSEAGHKKSVALVELREKGETEVELIPLKPRRDMREIRGSLSELTAQPCGNLQDYIRATLTDKEELLDPVGRLRAVYPNIMRLDFENAAERASYSYQGAAKNVEEKTGMELFAEFYEEQVGMQMDEMQKALMMQILKEAGGDML